MLLKAADVLSPPQDLCISRGVALLEEFTLKSEMITPHSDIRFLTPDNIRAYLLNTVHRQVELVKANVEKKIEDLKDWELSDIVFVRKMDDKFKSDLRSHATVVATRLYWMIANLTKERNEDALGQNAVFMYAESLLGKRKKEDDDCAVAQVCKKVQKTNYEGESERIALLESKLHESKERELELLKELLTVTKELESFKQKFEQGRDSHTIGLLTKARSVLEGRLDAMFGEHRSNRRYLSNSCYDWLNHVEKEIVENRKRGKMEKVCIKDLICHHTLVCDFGR